MELYIILYYLSRALILLLIAYVLRPYYTPIKRQIQRFWILGAIILTYALPYIILFNYFDDYYFSRYNVLYTFESTYIVGVLCAIPVCLVFYAFLNKFYNRFNTFLDILSYDLIPPPPAPPENDLDYLTRLDGDN